MFIKEILTQNRRDFTAEYQCEHCNHKITRGGYDDRNFHDEVVPYMVCESCGASSGGNIFSKIETKYEEGFQV